VDLDQMAALRTPEGVSALTAATAVAGGDPLAAAAALRARGVAPDLAASALTQAKLRRRARDKFGADADVMLFTRAGLEQATRAAVAARRAARLRAAGVGTLADLGCGLGADAIAAARAGIRVYGIESDPATAALATANAAALGLAGSIEIRCADATSVDLSGVDAVFCDPARRRAGTGPGAGRRVFDPAQYSPPWDFVAGLPARVPRTVLKLAPGIDHALLPHGAEGEWVSVDGDVVEATAWCGPLAGVPRRATVLRGGWSAGLVRPGLRGSRAHTSPAAEITGPGTAVAPVAPPRRFLYDPDGAVVRAHLVAEFAATVDGTLADPRIAYVYTDEPAATPYARCFEIEASLPFSLKRLRAALRERGVGRLEILKRGSALEPDRLRRDLRLAGPASATLVLTRVADAPTALLCRPRLP
jgi:SAM-dependent methyltransferase